MHYSSKWRHYFEANAKALIDIPWDIGPELTAHEIAVIQESLREFQAGEGSEGSHLIRSAEEYVAASGDSAYLIAIKLFIAEEQRHSRDLGKFLILNGISPVKTTFTDQIFRKMRHCVGGLETSIAVLVTAEIIARVYYQALSQSSDSIILKRLCAQILSDEVRHVEFQCEQLAKLRESCGPIGRVVRRNLQRLFFSGTVCLVWLLRRKVIQAGSFSFIGWKRACWNAFNEAFHPAPLSLMVQRAWAEK